MVFFLKSRKASFFFTLDALISFFLISAAFFSLYKPIKTDIGKDLLANDLMNLVNSLDNLKVHEINNETLKQQVSLELGSKTYTLAESLVLLSNSNLTLASSLGSYISRNIKPVGRYLTLVVIDEKGQETIVYEEHPRKASTGLSFTLPIILFENNNQFKYYFLRITLEV